jgi:predicted amidohydrolase
MRRKNHISVFPEMCTLGYHFLTQSSKEEILDIAEPIDGPIFQALHKKAQEANIVILYGMLELGEDVAYNTYVVVGPEGLIHSYRKVHAFENTYIAQGDKLTTFEMYGWTCGILICYDNNLPENARVLALQGADMIFAPHQTGGFDIEKAGMGRIPLSLWEQREQNPQAMRQAILGPKGYQWITKWLPCRAYDNNLYYVFSNGVGIDGPEVRVGCNMIIDPEGIILSETTEAADDMIVAVLPKSGRQHTLAGSHVMARRPSLYSEITNPIEEIDTRNVRNLVSGETII